MSDFSQKIVLGLLGFVLTGVLGNFLVHRWQTRSWIAQQRFLGAEKEYLALKELVDEIVTLLGARVYHMQRLALALGTFNTQGIEVRSIEHDEAVKKWNERLSSFYVRLPLLLQEGLELRLENEFQTPLAGLSERLSLAKRKSSEERRAELKGLTNSLNVLQGKSVRFNRELAKIVGERRKLVYFGEYLPFTRANIERFSSAELLKALFVPDIDAHAVFRSPLNA